MSTKKRKNSIEIDRITKATLSYKRVLTPPAPSALPADTARANASIATRKNVYGEKTVSKKAMSKLSEPKK